MKLMAIAFFVLMMGAASAKAEERNFSFGINIESSALFCQTHYTPVFVYRPAMYVYLAPVVVCERPIVVAAPQPNDRRRSTEQAIRATVLYSYQHSR
jgi:hypothetical protein